MSSSYLLTIKTVEGRKGRSFQGIVLAIATGLCDKSQAMRPLVPTMLMVACAPGEAKAMLENLRARHDAVLSGKGLRADVEMKGPTYVFDTFEAGPAVVITAHVPEAFDYEPGVTEDSEVRFGVMPAHRDVSAMIHGRAAEVESALEHVRKAFALADLAGFKLTPRLVGEAAVVAWYLGQRSEPPRLDDLSFSTQLFIAAQLQNLMLAALPLDPAKDTRRDVAVKHIGFRAYVAPGVQMLPGVGFRATHEHVGKFMAEQVRIFDDVKRGVVVRRAERLPKRPALQSLLGGFS